VGGHDQGGAAGSADLQALGSEGALLQAREQAQAVGLAQVVEGLDQIAQAHRPAVERARQPVLEAEGDVPLPGQGRRRRVGGLGIHPVLGVQVIGALGLLAPEVGVLAGRVGEDLADLGASHEGGLLEAGGLVHQAGHADDQVLVQAQQGLGHAHRAVLQHRAGVDDHPQAALAGVAGGELGQQRAREGGAQRVVAVVEGVGADRRRDVLVGEQGDGVLDDAVAGERPGPRRDRLERRRPTEVRHQRDTAHRAGKLRDLGEKIGAVQPSRIEDQAAPQLLRLAQDLFLTPEDSCRHRRSILPFDRG
jgi:hypothetical protein